MGYDEKTADRLRRILAGRGDVVEKKMVGGLSFMVDGTLCCGVADRSLVVRLGEAARKRALAQPHVRPMTLGGRPLKAFILVDPEGYRTAAALARWVRKGLADLPFGRVVAAFARDTQVTRGGKGFGSTGLKVNGKLFAMVSPRTGQFVAKLPRPRVDALVKARKGEYFDPGHGRKMKEWVAVGRAGPDWVVLAKEARRFVGEGGR
jgi:TfoX/Sxy family transcriptional regulator of competence genes